MREALEKRWTDIGDKIVAMADDFPSDRYDFAPADGVRSFADQLRHVAFWNQYVGAALAGGTPDGTPNELPRSAYPTKGTIASVLKASFHDVISTLGKKNGSLSADDLDTLVSFIEHNGEHYGQLAVYYRLNGLVPPASR